MQLEIHGEVDLHVSGSQARLSAKGSLLDLHFDDARRFGPEFGRLRWRALSRLLGVGPFFTYAGLTLNVYSGGKLIVTAGRGAKSGWLARLAGIRALEFGDKWRLVRVCLNQQN
jgi:hypothetical protein